MQHVCQAQELMIKLPLRPPPIPPNLLYLSSSLGNHLFRPLCAVLSLHRLRRGGTVGGNQLRVPPPQTDPAHVQHVQGNHVPRQQHGQPGHVRGVPHQHAGLDDPLAGAE